MKLLSTATEAAQLIEFQFSLISYTECSTVAKVAQMGATVPKN
jgi:hypothetical protein